MAGVIANLIGGPSSGMLSGNCTGSESRELKMKNVISKKPRSTMGVMSIFAINLLCLRTPGRLRCVGSGKFCIVVFSHQIKRIPNSTGKSGKKLIFLMPGTGAYP
jgi:hypothetical protein